MKRFFAAIIIMITLVSVSVCMNFKIITKISELENAINEKNQEEILSVWEKNERYFVVSHSKTKINEIKEDICKKEYDKALYAIEIMKESMKINIRNIF